VGVVEFQGAVCGGHYFEGLLQNLPPCLGLLSSLYGNLVRDLKRRSGRTSPDVLSGPLGERSNAFAKAMASQGLLGEEIVTSFGDDGNEARLGLRDGFCSSEEKS